MEERDEEGWEDQKDEGTRKRKKQEKWAEKVKNGEFELTDEHSDISTNVPNRPSQEAINFPKFIFNTLYDPDPLKSILPFRPFQPSH